MNRFACEQNAMVGGGYELEGMKMVDSVLCPKPRRLSALNPSLNDLILNKGDGGSMKQLASSPPFFSGSPPSRASNPVVQDEQFGNNSKVGPFSPTTAVRGGGGGCVRMKSGDKPLARIEGFDCLSRDRRNCSIPSVA